MIDGRYINIISQLIFEDENCINVGSVFHGSDLSVQPDSQHHYPQ